MDTDTFSPASPGAPTPFSLADDALAADAHGCSQQGAHERVPVSEEGSMAQAQARAACGWQQLPQRDGSSCSESTWDTTDCPSAAQGREQRSVWDVDRLLHLRSRRNCTQAADSDAAHSTQSRASSENGDSDSPPVSASISPVAHLGTHNAGEPAATSTASRAACTHLHAYRRRQRERLRADVVEGSAASARAALASMHALELRGSHAAPVQHAARRAAVPVAAPRMQLSPVPESVSRAGHLGSARTASEHMATASTSSASGARAAASVSLPGATAPRRARRRQWERALEPEPQHAAARLQPIRQERVILLPAHDVRIAEVTAAHTRPQVVEPQHRRRTHDPAPPWWHLELQSDTRHPAQAPSAALGAVRLPPVARATSQGHLVAPVPNAAPASPDLSPYGAQAATATRAVSRVSALQALKSQRRSVNQERMSRLYSRTSSHHGHSERSGAGSTVFANRAGVSAAHHACDTTHDAATALADEAEQPNQCAHGAAPRSSSRTLQRHAQSARHDSEWQERLDAVRSALAAAGAQHATAVPTGDAAPSCSVHSSQGQGSEVAAGRRARGPGDVFAGLSLEEVLAQGRRCDRGRGGSFGARCAAGDGRAGACGHDPLQWTDQHGGCASGSLDHCSVAQRRSPADAPFGGMSLAEVLQTPAAPDAGSTDEVGTLAALPTRARARRRSVAHDDWGGSSLAEVLATSAAARRAAEDAQQSGPLPETSGLGARARSASVQGPQGRRRPAERPAERPVWRDDATESSSTTTEPALTRSRSQAPPRRRRAPASQHVARQPSRAPTLADLMQPLTSREVLMMLDRFVFGAPSAPAQVGGGGGAHECSVCLDEFHAKQIVRRYPGCGHCYHEQCIDAWLARGDARCPLCRWDPVKAGW